jgi:hypothetical protein
VQVVVHVGDALTEAELDLIPVPAEEPGSASLPHGTDELAVVGGLVGDL